MREGKFKVCAKKGVLKACAKGGIPNIGFFKVRARDGLPILNLSFKKTIVFELQGRAFRTHILKQTSINVCDSQPSATSLR